VGRADEVRGSAAAVSELFDRWLGPPAHDPPPRVLLAMDLSPANTNFLFSESSQLLVEGHGRPIGAASCSLGSWTSDRSSQLLGTVVWASSVSSQLLVEGLGGPIGAASCSELWCGPRP